MDGFVLTIMKLKAKPSTVDGNNDDRDRGILVTVPFVLGVDTQIYANEKLVKNF